MTGRRSKYGNVPCELDGIRFPSKAERNYYATLKVRAKAGEVSDIELQKPYELRGLNSHVIATYRADFAFYDHHEGRARVVDVKGGKATQTDVFRLKRKLMQDNHGITVEVAS